MGSWDLFNSRPQDSIKRYGGPTAPSAPWPQDWSGFNVRGEHVGDAGKCWNMFMGCSWDVRVISKNLRLNPGDLEENSLKYPKKDPKISFLNENCST